MDLAPASIVHGILPRGRSDDRSAGRCEQREVQSATVDRAACLLFSLCGPVALTWRPPWPRVRDFFGPWGASPRWSHAIPTQPPVARVSMRLRRMPGGADARWRAPPTGHHSWLGRVAHGAWRTWLSIDRALDHNMAPETRSLSGKLRGETSS
jgi:hypothetical protein